jgi:hypothetical protein
MCATVQCGGHLYAAVGFDTVKLFFIAYPAIDYGFVEPLAPFNR